MAHVQDPNFIIDKMHSEKLSLYKVVDHDGKTIIDENNDKEIGVDEAARRLLDTFSKLSGVVTVKLSDKTGKEKAEGGAIRNLSFTTKLGGSLNGIGAIPQNNTPAINIAEIEARLEEKYNQKLEAYKKEQELLKRIEKLEEEKAAPDDLEKYAPLIQGLFGFINGGPQPMAGNNPNINGTGETSEIHSRINAAIKILYRNDKNFVSNLEKLADIAQNKPLVYAIAIEKLKEY